MGDAIIMVVILIVLIFAVKGSLKHFKGEGACCGGGSGSVKPKKPKKKTLDGPVIGRRTIRISGMHCQNHVSLKDNRAEVSYDRAVDESVLKQAVEGAGFEVVSIS